MTNDPKQDRQGRRERQEPVRPTSATTGEGRTEREPGDAHAVTRQRAEDRAVAADGPGRPGDPAGTATTTGGGRVAPLHTRDTGRASGGTDAAVTGGPFADPDLVQDPAAGPAPESGATDRGTTRPSEAGQHDVGRGATARKDAGRGATARRAQQRPGEAAAPGLTEDVVSAPMVPQDECDKLTQRLREAVGTFVDEPRRSVEEAAGVLEEATDRLTRALAERPRALRAGWDSTSADGTSSKDGTDTEGLRLALRTYREVTERLLRI